MVLGGYPTTSLFWVASESVDWSHGKAPATSHADGSRGGGPASSGGDASHGGGFQDTHPMPRRRGRRHGRSQGEDARG